MIWGGVSFPNLSGLSTVAVRHTQGRSQTAWPEVPAAAFSLNLVASCMEWNTLEGNS